MDSKLKILFVEDVKSDYELILREIKKSGIMFSNLLVDNRKDFIDGLKSFNPDIIISDYYLPQFDGRSALMLRNEYHSYIPFILVTGSLNEEIAVECMKAGAEDYILKENLTRIGPAVANSINKIKILKQKMDAEETIDQERRMLRALIDNLPDLIYIKDIYCRKVIANKADVCNIGFSEEADVLGKTDTELYPGETGRRGYVNDKKVISSEKAIFEHEEDFIDYKGVKRWLLTTKVPLYDKGGKITGLVGIGHDITARKQRETELLQSYMFNDSLLKTIPFAMDIVDEEGTVMFNNDKFKRLFGEDAIGKKCWELYRDDKTQCKDCPLLSGIKIGLTDAYESHGVLGNRIFEISHTGMMYKDKKAMLEIFQDITYRKEKEEELIRAMEKAEESERLKTAFLHNISHEIRTPLNAIVGFSSLLSEPDIDSITRNSYIEMIINGSDHLLAIITDIVEISNIEANIIKTNKKGVNLNSIIRSIHKQYLPKTIEKKIDFITEPDLADDESTILADNKQLIQIISSLLNNAIKYTCEGSISLGYKIKGKFLEFFVSDTGLGIPEMYQHKIFNRFFQIENPDTKLNEGTGLGLTISKAYVELMGGIIWVESTPGAGSTFYFTIPYDKSASAVFSTSTPLHESNIAFAEKKRILVAEDVESNFKLISYYLHGANADVIRAHNGKEAVEKCLSDQTLDLILMDIKMPIMDGYTAVKLIREFNPGIPIIAQTAYADDNVHSIECGCSEYIIKPFDKTGLINIIRKFI
jgi:PAS domain S-box-containing protein